MLQTNDLGEIFAQFQAAYGAQWKQDASAIPLWQQALKDVDRQGAMVAVRRCTSELYTNYPPTLGQFLACCAVRPRPNTYLPAPNISRVTGVANLTMLRSLIAVKGVDKMQLTKMTALKNALVDELGIEPVTQEWLDDIRSQLDALAAA